MIIPIDVTIEQLRAFTKTQLINKLSTWLTANFTKRQLILWLMGIDSSSETVSTYSNGLEIKTETTRDVETNAVINTKIITYTLYPTGEVDEITIVNKDGSGVEINRKVIKHYTDGRQPTVT